MDDFLILFISETDMIEFDFAFDMFFQVGSLEDIFVTLVGSQFFFVEELTDSAISGSGCLHRIETLGNLTQRRLEEVDID